MNPETIANMIAETEQLACLKKVTHMSSRIAEDECNRLRLKTGHKNLVPYRCSFCMLWHVGHPKTPQRLKAEMMIAKMN